MPLLTLAERAPGRPTAPSAVASSLGHRGRRSGRERVPHIGEIGAERVYPPAGQTLEGGAHRRGAAVDQRRGLPARHSGKAPIAQRSAACAGRCGQMCRQSSTFMNCAINGGAAVIAPSRWPGTQYALEKL